MKIRRFCSEEIGATPFTDVAEISYTDLVALGAVTSGTLSLITGLTAGAIVTGAAYSLVTPFDGGATSALALDVGFNGASVDDPDAFLDNYQVHLDGTEVLAGDGNGAAFATLRTGHAFVESADIEALFTATGGNLNALTAGKIRIYLAVTRLGEFAP